MTDKRLSYHVDIILDSIYIRTLNVYACSISEMIVFDIRTRVSFTTRNMIQDSSSINQLVSITIHTCNLSQYIRIKSYPLTFSQSVFLIQYVYVTDIRLYSFYAKICMRRGMTFESWLNSLIIIHYRIIQQRVYTHVCAHICVFCLLFSLVLILQQILFGNIFHKQNE